METGLVRTPSFNIRREPAPSRENGFSLPAGHPEGGRSNSGHPNSGHSEVGHLESGHSNSGHSEGAYSNGGHSEGGYQEKGGRRAEYLLVIYPGVELQEKLLKEQEQFATDFGLQVKVRNKPHVTLAAFQAGEVMEDMLIRWIQRISNCYTSFDLTLNNYSGFPPHTTAPPEVPERSEGNERGSKTRSSRPSGQTSADCRECDIFSGQRIPGIIYLRVQDPRPFRMLMQQLQAIDEFIRSSGCPAAHLFTRPFLTIAGGLTEQVYNKAMPDFSRRTFHDTFHVGELVLLKRSHAFDACRTVNIFRLRQPQAEPMSRWPLPHI